MLWWLLLLTPELPHRPDLYPPEGCILLQRSGRVTLRWNLPGKKFEVKLWKDEALVSQVKTTDASFPVSVTSGGRYRWTVTPTVGKARRHAFSVTDDFSYHCDGRTGGLGLSGENGGQVTAELKRDQYGMNLFIGCKDQPRLHYLFQEPGIRFTLTSRGGNGGPGRKGRDHAPDPGGGSGGNAGWGGNIKVITHNAPWREYLDIDVRAGQPGQGGPGGWFYNQQHGLTQAINGDNGRPGRGGRVETHLQP